MNTLKQILNFTVEHWEYIAPLIAAILELILRRIPTKRNVSLFDNLWKLLNFLVANRRKETFKEIPAGRDNKGNDLNKINVRTDQHILKSLLILFLFSISFSSFSQNPVYTKSRGLIMYNLSDTANFQYARDLAEISTDKVAGGIFVDIYNKKYRVWDLQDSVWVDWYPDSTGTTLDSTNFWRTKSDFEVFGDRTINHDGLILFEGQDAFNTFEIGADYVTMNSTDAGMSVNGSTTTFAGGNAQQTIDNNGVLIEANGGGTTTADFIVTGQGGNMFDDISFTGLDNVNLISDGATSNGEVNISNSLVQIRQVDSGGTNRIETHNFGIDVIVGATNDDLSIITNGTADDIVISSRDDVSMSSIDDIILNPTSEVRITSASTPATAGIYFSVDGVVTNKGTFNINPTDDIVTLNGGNLTSLIIGNGTGANTFLSKFDPDEFTLSDVAGTQQIFKTQIVGGDVTQTFSGAIADDYTLTVPDVLALNSSGVIDFSVENGSTHQIILEMLTTLNYNFTSNGLSLTESRASQGTFTIDAGTQSSSNIAGTNLNLTAGTGGAGNANGGGMTFTTGNNTGSGIDGDFHLDTRDNGKIFIDGTLTRGTAVLVGGTVVVSNANVTANSIILLTSNTDGGTPGFVRVSARSAGTSFTITSSSGTDTSTIAWFIFEP